MSEELKPCPFCGGEARWVEDHGRFDEPFGLVVDHAEDCFLGNHMMAEWDHIIAAWNHRQSATTEALAAMEQAREALVSIEEYWNRDRNDEAMHDACWHAVETSAQALTTLTEQIERMRGEAQQPSGAMTGE